MVGVRPEASTLTNVRQQQGESLKSYLTRFNIEVARACNVDDSGYLMAVKLVYYQGVPFGRICKENP